MHPDFLPKWDWWDNGQMGLLPYINTFSSGARLNDSYQSILSMKGQNQKTLIRIFWSF